METNTPSPPPGIPSCLFSGQYRLRLDEKGRLTLPSAFRRKLPAEAPEEVALLPGPDGYLQVLPVPEWEDRMRRLEASATGSPKQLRERRRRLYATVECVPLDEKGRLTIPEALLQAAGIAREVLAAGANRGIELWAPERWDAADQQANPDLSGTETILY